MTCQPQLHCVDFVAMPTSEHNWTHVKSSKLLSNLFIFSTWVHTNFSINSNRQSTRHKTVGNSRKTAEADMAKAPTREHNNLKIKSHQTISFCNDRQQSISFNSRAQLNFAQHSNEKCRRISHFTKASKGDCVRWQLKGPLWVTLSFLLLFLPRDCPKDSSSTYRFHDGHLS